MQINRPEKKIYAFCNFLDQASISEQYAFNILFYTSTNKNLDRYYHVFWKFNINILLSNT